MMSTDTSTTTPLSQRETAAPDVLKLIRLGGVAVAGRLAAVSFEDFTSLVESIGGRCHRRLAGGTTLVVIGQRDWPLNRDGQLPELLRRLRIRRRERPRSAPPVVSEQQFLTAIGRHDLVEGGPGLYTTATLVSLLDVPRERIVAWVKAGLIEPVTSSQGVWQFDFRQVVAARTLSDLWRNGVPIGRLRKSLRQLRALLPEVEHPFQQLAAIERRGELLVRLEAGDLAAADGQLMIEFDQPATADGEEADTAPLPMRLVPAGPTTAAEWHEQAIEQEQAGYLEEAAESYREALRIGGPDAQLCFDLAHCLHALGRRQQAIERYLQATEINRDFGDAWNNLGLVLCEIGRREAACTAFRRAIIAEPHDARGYYNLADTLDELKKATEAAEHWRAYLRYDGQSEHAAYARQRLAVSE